MPRRRAYGRHYAATVIRCRWTDADGTTHELDCDDWPQAANVKASLPVGAVRDSFATTTQPKPWSYR